MARQRDAAPPPRKAPGLIGRLIGGMIGIVISLVISLLVSIVIEWAGMTWVWHDEGVNHAKAVLANDKALLNTQFAVQSSLFKRGLIDKANQATNWIERQTWFNTLNNTSSHLPTENMMWLRKKIDKFAQHYYHYIEVIHYVTQTFVIRLTLILFSLPIFVLAWGVGFIDGLTERELRRWGGGRESSNVFNLARRSVAPSFIFACVIYISLPYSINPSIIMLPFAVMVWLTVRMTMARLKKYF